MSHPARFVTLLVVLTLAFASCSGSSDDGKSKWSANSMHSKQRSRGR